MLLQLRLPSPAAADMAQQPKKKAGAVLDAKARSRGQKPHERAGHVTGGVTKTPGLMQAEGAFYG